MNSKKNKIGLLTLFFISFLSGGLWHFEIVYNKWHFLKWVYNFHYAVPISFLLFIIWANIFSQSNRIIVTNILSILYGFLLYFIVPHALISNARMGFLFPIFLICCIPLGAFIILKIGKTETSFKKLIISTIGMILSFPLSFLILYIFDNSDGLMPFKSGILLPFWMISLGILVISKKKN